MRNNKPNFFKIRKRLMIEVDYSLAQINGIIQFYREISLGVAMRSDTKLPKMSNPFISIIQF